MTPEERIGSLVRRLRAMSVKPETPPEGGFLRGFDAGQRALAAHVLDELEGAGLADVERCTRCGTPLELGDELPGRLHVQCALEASLRARAAPT